MDKISKHDRFFEVGKKYSNYTSKWFSKGSYGKDGYVMLLSRTPKKKGYIDDFGNAHVFDLYPIICNGKKGWAEIRLCKPYKGTNAEKIYGEEEFESLHRVTSTGKNWAPHSVACGPEVYEEVRLELVTV